MRGGVPETMRAAAIDRFGGPQVVTVQVLPVPGIHAGEVLIAVHTAGVASWDAEMRAGSGRFGGCTARVPLHWRNLA